MQCSSNLSQIGIAIEQYYTAEGCFPPAYLADEDGKPMHSWRVALLPYLGFNALHYEYDFSQPWDGPKNRRVIDSMPPRADPAEFFACPSARGKSGETNYMMIVGPGTISDGTSSCTLAEITDGASETILVMEVVDSGVHWAEPRDLTLAEFRLSVNGRPGKAPASAHPGTFLALLADGSVQSYWGGHSTEMIMRMATIADWKDSSDEVTNVP